MTFFIQDKALKKEVKNMIESYALYAIDIAREKFGITLDWSEESIEKVEYILDRLHKKLPLWFKIRVSFSKIFNTSLPKRVILFSNAFGSYIGEVYRRHHPAQWGIDTDYGSLPCLLVKDGSVCWPWARVRKRLMNGAEDCVQSYYYFLTHVETDETVPE